MNSASFNRFTSIAKASSTYNKTRIIGIRPSENAHEAKKILSPITDSLFLYNFRNKTNKLVDLFKSYRTVKKQLIILTKNTEQKEILFIYSTNVIDYILYYFLSKQLNFKYVTERNEYPTLIRSKVLIKSFFYKTLLLPWIYKLFDGIILMTDPLIGFYTPYLKKEAQILKVPMTVDFERFEIENNMSTRDTKYDYIFYAGSLSQSKDGIETLIESFIIAKKNIKSLKLKIAGGSKNEIDQLVSKYSLHKDNSIEFLGTVERDKIPKLIIEASILVLPRPKSKQAEGGFPTKLGEYLASGNPIIATPVGDIPKYLTNDKEVLFCYDFSPISFAECIIKIFNRYDYYKTIGENGKNTAKKYFSLNNYSENLKDFFNLV